MKAAVAFLFGLSMVAAVAAAPGLISNITTLDACQLVYQNWTVVQGYTCNAGPVDNMAALSGVQTNTHAYVCTGSVACEGLCSSGINTANGWPLSVPATCFYCGINTDTKNAVGACSVWLAAGRLLAPSFMILAAVMLTSMPFLYFV